MKPTTWKDIVEFTGIAALVASLIFVGLQMKQTHEIAMAATYQARTDSEMSIFGLIFESESLERAMVKVTLGEPLTDYEKTVLTIFFNPLLMYYENAHFQWEQGLVTDEFWIVQREGLKSGGFNTEPFREYWPQARGGWRRSFAQVVDEVLVEMEADN